MSNESQEDRRVRSDAPQEPKKTYETPLLVNYGSVADLTRGLGSGEQGGEGGGPV